MNKIEKIVADFKWDIKHGGSFLETFHRKFAHTFITHRYELHILKPYYNVGLVLNVGAGRDCGKLGNNIISLDIRCGIDDYICLQNWNPIYPDIIADAEQGLPFKDNVFDCTMSMHFLEHVRNPETVLNEMIRITKPEKFVCGILPCSIKNKPYNYWKDKTHVQIWTKKDFLLWLSQRDFFDKVNLIQYCKMNRWLNPWSFDFVLRKKKN